MATAAALMPDAHVGYGLPIGGVLALENAVVPYAVGVDIACRMKLSVLDLPAGALGDRHKFELFASALEAGTRFGVGSTHQAAAGSRGDGRRLVVTRSHARKQGQGLEAARHQRLGQSFCRVRPVDALSPTRSWVWKRASTSPCSAIAAAAAPGPPFARPTARIARARLPKKYEALGRLAWLDLDSAKPARSIGPR